MITLPNTLSGLLDHAITTLDQCIKDPQYTIDLMEYHTPKKSKKRFLCIPYKTIETTHVCLAGTVLAKTFNTNPNTVKSPATLDRTQNIDPLYALSSLAFGNIKEAASQLARGHSHDNSLTVPQLSTATTLNENWRMLRQNPRKLLATYKQLHKELVQHNL